jgi:hypothetical protein
LPEPAARPIDARRPARRIRTSSAPAAPRDRPRLCSILAAALIGGFAYKFSREQVVGFLRQDTLNHARTCAEFFASTPPELSEADALARLRITSRRRSALPRLLPVRRRPRRAPPPPHARHVEAGRVRRDRLLLDEGGNRPPVSLRDLFGKLAPGKDPVDASEDARGRVGT